MTGVASLARPDVASDFFMFVVHPRLGMFMTIGTDKLSRVRGFVTLGAVEFLVRPVVDRECVIELSLIPAHVGRQMTPLT